VNPDPQDRKVSREFKVNPAKKGLPEDRVSREHKVRKVSREYKAHKVNRVYPEHPEDRPACAAVNV
jgi:hypothetical protein